MSTALPDAPDYTARQRARDLAHEFVRADPDTDLFPLARDLCLSDLDAPGLRDVAVAMLEIVGFLACLPADQLSEIPTVRLESVREILTEIGLT